MLFKSCRLKHNVVQESFSRFIFRIENFNELPSPTFNADSTLVMMEVKIIESIYLKLYTWMVNLCHDVTHSVLRCILSTLCVLVVLQKVIDSAEGAEEAAAEKTELEELKQLLPDVTEKVADAKESQRTASVASLAIQQTLVGTCMSAAPPPLPFCSFKAGYVFQQK